MLAVTSCVIASPFFFVIASETQQSISYTEIASAGFASIATTERKWHSGIERGHPFDACE
jgi:hypothetical protein